MATRERAQSSRSRAPVDKCLYATQSYDRDLELRRHHSLHPDGLRLITTWFERAFLQRDSDYSTFEAFVFAWISVNAWAACVTGQDRDREYMNRLANDRGLFAAFKDAYQCNDGFHAEIEDFFALLPIFKAQQLRRLNIYLDESVPRQERINRYFEQGLTEFEPECSQWHFENGQIIPRDWPHFIQAVYRIRCNLFHGEKSAHSEMDRRIVKTALLSLTSFFRISNIL